MDAVAGGAELWCNFKRPYIQKKDKRRSGRLTLITKAFIQFLTKTVNPVWLPANVYSISTIDMTGNAIPIGLSFWLTDATHHISVTLFSQLWNVSTTITAPMWKEEGCCLTPPSKEGMKAVCLAVSKMVKHEKWNETAEGKKPRKRVGMLVFGKDKGNRGDRWMEEGRCVEVVPVGGWDAMVKMTVN